MTPESLPDDIAALKRIIAEMARDAVTARAEIAKLKFQLHDTGGPNSGAPRRN